MASDRFHVSSPGVIEWEWTLDDVEAAHTVLDVIEEQMPEPPKHSGRRR
jgi:hypothetical protein